MPGGTLTLVRNAAARTPARPRVHDSVTSAGDSALPVEDNASRRAGWTARALIIGGGVGSLSVQGMMVGRVGLRTPTVVSPAPGVARGAAAGALLKSLGSLEKLESIPVSGRLAAADRAAVRAGLRLRTVSGPVIAVGGAVLLANTMRRHGGSAVWDNRDGRTGALLISAAGLGTLVHAHRLMAGGRLTNAHFATRPGLQVLRVASAAASVLVAANALGLFDGADRTDDRALSNAAATAWSKRVRGAPNALIGVMGAAWAVRGAMELRGATPGIRMMRFSRAGLFLGGGLALLAAQGLAVLIRRELDN